MKSLSFRKDLVGVQEELFRFAYKLTTDREEANDLLQETLRGQLNYDNTIAEIHQVSALAGIEFRETRTWQNGAYYYGYNEQTLLAASQIQNPYTNIWGWNSYLLDGSPETDYQRRFLSYYGNLSYTLMNKYVVTGSVRYDDYNNFGVDRKSS